MKKFINILFVDDQLCIPEEQNTIIASYGPLQRLDTSYMFHYETAEVSKNKYAIAPVIKKIASIPNLKAVILDIKFGPETDRLGLDILKAIRNIHPLLPVFMMTSIEGEVNVIEKAMELGANDYLVKMPSLTEMETLLSIYTQPSSNKFDFAIWGNSSAIKHVRALISRVSFSGAASVGNGKLNS